MQTEHTSTSVVAIFAIVLVLLIAGYIGYRAGVFSDGGTRHALDVMVK